MSNILEIENLSKQYRLGTVGTGTLSHDLNRWWYRMRGKEDPYLKIGEANDRSVKGSSEYVWALRDINLTVKEGEVLGIIGKNGAGKSTLLKILSKVTGPTTGSIKAYGRIASLLEVGTGFHPELTGRENIFLNGAILGMTKQEIRSKFDEIVDFSGVERYIDTPVKRYSSGMYVRLAFAVAAHLEPEILIVDEVLAVGDAEFQKKAIGKMKDVSQGQGRTVLFVSHNMGAVKNLCNQTVFLKNGKVESIGETTEMVNLYLADKGDIDGVYTNGVNMNLIPKCKTEGLTVENVELINLEQDKKIFESGDSIRLIVHYKSTKKFSSPAFVFKLLDEFEMEVARFSNIPIGNYPLEFNEQGKVILDIVNLNLVKGRYYIDFGFVHESIEWYFEAKKLIRLDIESKNIYGGKIELDRTRGLIWLKHRWNHE